MKKQMLNRLKISLAVSICLVVCGCAATRVVPDQHMDFPDMHIEVDPSGDVPAKFWDAYILFRQGNELFDAKRFEEAIPFYDKLLANYDNAEMVSGTLFNKALCYEGIGRYDLALPLYEKLRVEHPAQFDPVRLAFRYAYCYEKTEQWQKVRGVLAGVLTNPNATPVQKLQAEARDAMALFYSGEEEKAKAPLRRAIGQYQDLRERQITVDNFFFSKTCFTLGEYYYRRFLEVELKGENEELERNLDNKATIFLLARAQYLKSIKTYDHTYMFASLFRIAEGYEHFYFTMYNAPLPSDLKPSEVDEYNKKLREYIRPVFDKSIKAYQENIRLGKSLTEKNEWLIKSDERLRYLEKWQQEQL